MQISIRTGVLQVIENPFWRGVVHGVYGALTRTFHQDARLRKGEAGGFRPACGHRQIIPALAMHEDELDHIHLPEQEREEIARFIWAQESLELHTVGIDIGSSTAHLVFARLLLQRRSQELSSRFVVTEREVVWRSPIMLTPFLPDGTIDAGALGRFVRDCYAKAGFARSDIDSGAVILTGEAIKRSNARAIDELFAGEAGKFVCATAGHKLEATLAAHGSGAVALSRREDTCLLHVDIGGGTTKLALIDRGRILGVSAFAVGGRLLAADADGVWTRVDDSARMVAAELGLAPDAKSLGTAEARARIARRLAAIAADYILDAPRDELGQRLLLTEPLARDVAPSAITFSGGVSEYIFGREQAQYGDIARLLAAELRDQFTRRLNIPVIDPGQGIRATVIGASQFTVQVSGKTIDLPDRSILPVHNVPVVRLATTGELAPAEVRTELAAALRRLDLAPEARMAVAFDWYEAPEYRRIAATAQAILDVVAPEGRRGELLLLMIDGDVGKTFGHIMRDEIGLTGPFAAIDGVQLQELDFVDVGEFVDPPGVVPVVIKSLLFS
jgi:ethanolamine utilization protein EutA